MLAVNIMHSNINLCSNGSLRSVTISPHIVVINLLY